MFCAFPGHAQSVIYNDVVINEVLFNPETEGFDYVELYNRSDKPVQVRELLLANRNVTNDIASIKIITTESLLLQPDSFIVITVNAKWLKQMYYVPVRAKVLQVSSLPSFPDDEGSVVLIRANDTQVVDELAYNHNWHFQTISEKAGIALERIYYDYATQNRNNWTSASSASGYGTPGYENSQSRTENISGTRLSILPRIISPDNNGTDDLAQISINIDEAGWVANALVFDASGRRVRYLLRNEVLGTKNIFSWDGSDDRSRKLPIGIYILLTQLIDLNGRVEKYKHCIVLDGRK